MTPSHALAHARTHRARFLEELKAFIRFPTVSAQPRHAADLRRCATWLAAHLRWIGLQNVRIIPAARHPIVYAEWRQAAGRPTVLVYGHYDVQPADPLSEWHSPPFRPTIRGANIYGRGACDDKGQMFTLIKALESYLRTVGRLPVNVQCLFEGEEEIGSPSLQPFIARNKRHLQADIALISDTRMLAPDRPAINYAERGALGVEVEVHGPGKDLHSGNFGGAVHNPLQVLCEMVASLHEPDGRIAIAGFYDRVRRWSEDEREYMEDVGPSDSRLLRDADVH